MRELNIIFLSLMELLIRDSMMGRLILGPVMRAKDLLGKIRVFLLEEHIRVIVCRRMLMIVG